MDKSNLLTSENGNLNNNANNKASIPDRAFLDCVIASDTPRKLDFLILVIETLQINATIPY